MRRRCAICGSFMREARDSSREVGSVLVAVRICPRCDTQWECEPVPRCPDDGVCHHECPPNACFRVRCCGPLSGVFTGDEWPDAIKEQHTEGES